MPTRRRSWRCFHCDEVFHSRTSAGAHFGSDRYEGTELPACIDPLRFDEKARLSEIREAQQYALQCQESANAAEDKCDELSRELDGFRHLTKCRSTQELRMLKDSIEGEVITARKLIEAVRTKAPNIYDEVIQ